MRTSERRHRDSIVPTSSSPAASARAAVDGLRPSDAQTTASPFARRHDPTAAPISPGWRRPIVIREVCPPRDAEESAPERRRVARGGQEEEARPQASLALAREAAQALEERAGATSSEPLRALGPRRRRARAFPCD